MVGDRLCELVAFERIQAPLSNCPWRTAVGSSPAIRSNERAGWRRVIIVEQYAPAGARRHPVAEDHPDANEEETAMSRKTQEGVRPRRPKKLTPHEQRIRWDEDGDVEQLWGVVAAARWDLIVDMEQVFSLLLRAITVRAERDPAGFAAETFTRMIGYNTYLLMRSQMYINLRLGQHGRSTRALVNAIANVH
jgi:hypothetical protein